MSTIDRVHSRPGGRGIARPGGAKGSGAPSEDDAGAPARLSGLPVDRRPAGTQSIETAMRVLLMLADVEGPVGVTEIARALGLHKSTVSRQLAMLKVADFVSQDPPTSRYALGLGLLPLAANVLSAHRLSAAARLRLETLARTTREIVTQSGWDGRNAVNLDQFGQPNPRRPLAPPGRLNPAHCTATGKAFLADLPDTALTDRLKEPLARYTDLTVTDPRRLRAELMSTRGTGLAVSRGEFIPDVVAVAALVRPEAGAGTYAIAITLPLKRASNERLAELGASLLQAAGELRGAVSAVGLPPIRAR